MKVITVILIDAGRYCNTLTNLVHIIETTKTEALNSKCAIFFLKAYSTNTFDLAILEKTSLSLST